MSLQGKHVLLGVTGSISAYKACDLVQRLKDQGAVVRVTMTHSATQLVHPNTFAALTGYKVGVHAFSGSENGSMEHIDLARWADIFLIAPCTAHTLGECANGLTGSLLSLVYMVCQRPVFFAPAMNSVMLGSVAVRRNLGLLESKGDVILPTGEGVLACGEVGHGKLLEASHLIDYVKAVLARRVAAASLTGKKVLISAGHTREKWDDVRFISNRSSGKTGLALARSFWAAGADVEMVVGNIQETVPSGIRYCAVESSADFEREMLARQPGVDIIIMAAAIADFVPVQAYAGKQKDSKYLENIELRPFPNVLHELGNRKSKGQILIGFALETENAIAFGEAKMRERQCDIMVVNNPVAETTGFGKDRVQAAILTATASNPVLTEWDKDDLAASVVEHTLRIAPELPGGHVMQGLGMQGERK